MALPTTFPDAETIRRTAAEVVQRADYRLQPESRADEVVLSVILRGLQLLVTAFRSLFYLVEGLPEWLQWVVVVGLLLILFAICGHMAYSLYILIRSTRQRDAAALALPTVVLDPVKFERQAEEAAARGDSSLAVRLLFRACLLRMEKSESRKLRSGTTNREVLRRHRQAAVYEPLKVFVEIIETKWYGQGECSPADYQTCRVAHAELLRLTKGAGDVHDA